MTTTGNVPQQITDAWRAYRQAALMGHTATCAALMKRIDALLDLVPH